MAAFIEQHQPVLALSAVYLAAVAVAAAASAARSRNAFRRHGDIALSGLILLVILYDTARGFMQKASILPAAIFAVIVVIYTLMQESHINGRCADGSSV